MLLNVERVFKRLRAFDIRIGLNKCRFFPREFDFLGFAVSCDGLRPAASKVAAMAEFPIPQTVRAI